MRSILFIIFAFVSSLCFAIVKVPSILGDHMVLKRESNVCLWGWADPNEKIEIKTSWNKKSYKVNSDDKGRWSVNVQTSEAGGPYNIIIDDGEELILDDIYLGEVWLCSGQSNMAMQLKGGKGQNVNNSLKTISEANPLIPIRMFTVSCNASRKELKNCEGQWQLNESAIAANFSAVAYYYAIQLYKSLNVPIGLVNSSWGGTPIQAWMPESAFSSFKSVSLKHLTDEEIELKRPQGAAAMLYNGMINPIKKYSFSGVLWYQGEANRGNAAMYESMFKVFVDEWRKKLGNVDLPFYYAQIAPYKYENSESVGSALLREAQENCEKIIPNVGMAVLMDIGDENRIHPANKEEVGQRLAYLSLRHTYNYIGVESDSPRYLSKEISGDKIVLSFDRIGMGITSFGKPLNNFEISGDDGKYYPAKAKIIDGEKIQVWSDEVTSPVNVRYAFKNYAKGDLFGVNGLPVSSFRTDK